MKKSLLALTVVTLAPIAVHAASLKDLTGDIVEFVNASIIPLFYTLAFLLFIIGMVRFFFFGGEENRAKGKTFMLWGIIGFVVMFSVWGIVRILLTTFGVSGV